MRITLARVGLLATTTALAITGCASDPAPKPPLGRVDLRQAMSAGSDVMPVGVAVAPNGERFVFDRDLGLYQVTGDTAVAVVPMAAMPDPGTPLELPFTDLTALAPGVFALTAIGDGFLLDTSAMTLTQHFCYVPDSLPTYLTQRTDAIAYDAELDRLYAQPLTYNEAGEFQWSQLAGYERATGVDVEWYDLGESVKATAMTVIPGVGLVLGQGSKLSQYDVGLNQTIGLESLTRFGVQSIEGLAVDSAAGTLLVLDGSTDELVEIDLAQLSL